MQVWLLFQSKTGMAWGQGSSLIALSCNSSYIIHHDRFLLLSVLASWKHWTLSFTQLYALHGLSGFLIFHWKSRQGIMYFLATLSSTLEPGKLHWRYVSPVRSGFSWQLGCHSNLGVMATWISRQLGCHGNLDVTATCWDLFTIYIIRRFAIVI